MHSILACFILPLILYLIGILFLTLLFLYHFLYLGRYFALSCFSLAVQVTSKRAVTSTASHHDDNEDGKECGFMYYINDGVYGSFNCLIYDHAVVEPVLLKV